MGLVPLSDYPQVNDFLIAASDDNMEKGTGGINRNGVVRTPSCFNSMGQLLTDTSFALSVVEEQDLPDLSRFIILSFGADPIRLSSDLSAFERAIMQPATELLNGYSAIVAFAEVLQGLRSRLETKLAKGREYYLDCPELDNLATRRDKLQLAGKSSVVLALAKSHSTTEGDWHIDVLASVELRLQPCDAKIPFTLPWLDGIERKLGSLVGLGEVNARDLQPYLSNLCVDERVRRQGVGRVMVRAVEYIACQIWGYSRMYLHVDIDNKAAYNLYKSEGYGDVGRRWNPFWAGRAADIGYFYKNLKPEQQSEDEKALSSSKHPKSAETSQ
jgi:ribosomal protein S18 acetylase RimI-like enzyme